MITAKLKSMIVKDTYKLMYICKQMFWGLNSSLGLFHKTKSFKYDQ